MAIHTILGYKTVAKRDNPTVLYCGTDGNAAAASIARFGREYVKLEKYPIACPMIPIRVPGPPKVDPVQTQILTSPERKKNRSHE